MSWPRLETGLEADKNEGVVEVQGDFSHPWDRPPAPSAAQPHLSEVAQEQPRSTRAEPIAHRRQAVVQLETCLSAAMLQLDEAGAWAKSIGLNGEVRDLLSSAVDLVISAQNRLDALEG